MPILTLNINDWFYRLCRSFPKMDFVKEKFLLNKSIMIFKIAFVALSKLEERPKLQLSSNFWSYMLLKKIFSYDFRCATICDFPSVTWKKSHESGWWLMWSQDKQNMIGRNVILITLYIPRKKIKTETLQITTQNVIFDLIYLL
jgi:hypothetical protein